ncbi:hypothetical protein [Falsiroseomonas selenitidurans]|uniref:PASTA domain-containing protein n=1 Tax=Falsiroseomonas selenitidurans TaxID=2716335 RepID=A0ABX1E5G5_9PROT|nr:hypothetical protein [Falsiroseomonas selenitidurans]NKC32432.1 hypothetical protein [Falsiroseomonas selenitidurans]
MANRNPAGAARIDRTASLPWLLLLGATAGLALAQALPRQGEAVTLVFPPGLTEAAAMRRVLQADGWRPLATRRIGPLTLAVAVPGPGGAAGPVRGVWVMMRGAGAPCGAPTGSGQEDG